MAMGHQIIYKQLIARVLASLALVGMLGAQQPSVAPKNESSSSGKLKQQLAALAAAHHGRVAIFAKHLNTGRVIAINADQPVQTASVIKLAILFEAMKQVRAGNAKWDE